MIWPIILGVIIIISGYIIISKISGSEKLPHGIEHLPIVKGIPIFGILFQVQFSLCEHLLNLGKKYGNIFKIKMGMREIVILNNYEIIKKTMKDDGDNFSGRWKTNLEILLSDDTGVIFVDGEKWSIMRSFVLKILRNFGVGKSKAVEIVQNECQLLIDELDTLGERKSDFNTLISLCTVNIISMFVIRKHFKKTDPKVKYLEYAMYELAKKQNIGRLLHLMFPFLDNSKPFSKFVLWISSKSKIYDNLTKVFNEEAEEHLKVLDMNSEGEDLMDEFLIEQNRLIVKNGTPGTFTNKQLAIISFELLGAGYETTSTTLGWSMLFMSRYQDVQQKVHDEIIDIIGSERLPTMNDKKSLIYTQAVMDEIMRMSSIVPLSLIHRTFKDSNVDGYLIPKDTLIIPNLYSCHRDPNTWKKPFEFYPEHFLQKLENGELKYLTREELIPFGIGKRQCLGESLARMEYFIFFIGILQRFRVSFNKDLSNEEYEDAIRANEGVIRFSKITDFNFDRY